VGAPVSYGLDVFKDRERERERLGQLLAEPGTRLITIVGRRGIGKSALAAKVLHDIEHAPRPPSWLAGVVNTSTRTSGISLERIYLDCARLLGSDDGRRLLDVWTGRQDTAGKVETLLTRLARRAT
jgi:hypothetical protein